MILLSYSIATGIGLGFIAYVALKVLAGRVREIAGGFLLKLIFA
jgi:xanthine/uracil/vitamin C permease (AzgA family)